LPFTHPPLNYSYDLILFILRPFFYYEPEFLYDYFIIVNMKNINDFHSFSFYLYLEDFNELSICYFICIIVWAMVSFFYKGFYP